MADHHTTIHQISGQLMGQNRSTVVIVAITALNGGTSTHYDGLPQEVLIMNKLVIVNKVYYKVERYMCYSIRHIHILGFESHPLFSPDLVFRGLSSSNKARIEPSYWLKKIIR